MNIIFNKGYWLNYNNIVLLYFSLFIILILFSPNLFPQTKRIYIANDDHTDLFWTADEQTYTKAFITMLDYYLALADSTQNEPSDFQSRFNCDGSYWLWVYQKNKTPAEFQRLISRLQDGHISAPLNALVVCQGGAPAEAVIRGMYYAGKLQREYNLPFDMAIAMENQTLPYGLAGLWASAGAKYSWKGVCGCDSRLGSFNNREHEIYWMEGPGKSKILMKWNSLFGANTSIGGYAEAYSPASVVDFVSSDQTFINKYPYDVIGAFGRGWDNLQTLTNEFVSVAKEKTNANRQVIVSNEEDFFNDFDSTYGASLPVVSKSFGNEWDVYCASLAEESARIKRAVEKLRAAEAMASIVNIAVPGFMAGRENQRDQAWMDLGLYWEHDFGMASRSGALVDERIAWQKRLATEVENYVNTLYADASAQLGSLIKDSSNYSRFYVFNQLNWKRTDYADFLYNGQLAGSCCRCY